MAKRKVIPEISELNEMSIEIAMNKEIDKDQRIINIIHNNVRVMELVVQSSEHEDARNRSITTMQNLIKQLGRFQ